MNAIEKSIRRHQNKLHTKKQPQKVPIGLGMGWPEARDRAEYIAAKIAADPEYSPSHDGKLWAIV